MDADYHVPVLLQEAIDGLDIQESGTYVDVTFGGGGHSRQILRRLGPEGRLLAFDRDPDAAARAAQDSDFVRAGHRFILVRENFRYLKNYLRFYKVVPVDGILADLGVSSHQFDVAERGFSIRSHGPLDMRMDQAGSLTASEVLNTYSEEELARIFVQYGEIPFGRRLASAVVKAREEASFEYTDQAVDFFIPFAGKGKENKFLATVFQALRIEVNGEMENLKGLLEQSLEVLKPGGRLVVISYHSLEDRMVKNIMKTGNISGKMEQDFYGRIQAPLKVVNNKVIVPTEEEVERNPRSRSAKLRIAEKTGGTDNGR